MATKRPKLRAVSAGGALRAERQRRGLNQHDAAKFVGVSGAQWSKWERDLEFPSAPRLLKVAAFLEMPVDELLMFDPGRISDRLAHVEARLDAIERLLDERVGTVERLLEELVRQRAERAARR